MNERRREQHRRGIRNSMEHLLVNINLTSHMIAERSIDEEAKYFPLCENCKNQTSSLCSCNIYSIMNKNNYLSERMNEVETKFTIATIKEAKT